MRRAADNTPASAPSDVDPASPSTHRDSRPPPAQDTPNVEETLPLSAPAARPPPEGLSAHASPSGGYRQAVEGRRYAIQEELAQGGIGRILRARDEGLERPVAVKELLKYTPAAEWRFMREALLTARLQHPGIVPVYDAGHWPSGEPFYAMKLVAGRPLSQVIAEARSIDDRLTLLPQVLAAAEAIAYAHSEGIIHRDLKPQNILIGSFGETVVIDWGLAKDLRADVAEQIPEAPPSDVAPTEGAELTVAGSILGTPSYMAPEQAAGRSVDARADVHALGAILYHLLAGRPPYRGSDVADIIRAVLRGPPEPIERLQRGVPRELATLVHKAMARESGERYPTAKEFAEDLRRFQAGQIVRAHHYSPAERLARFVRRYRAPLASLAVTLLAISFLGALAIRRIVEARDLATQERDRATVAGKRATERADSLTLTEARNAVGRDPLEALAWLKTLSPSFAQPRTVRVIAADALSRAVPRVLRGHTATVNKARFSPDGRWLATSSDDRSVRLWDVATGEARVLTGHQDEVWEIAFSPDGRRLVSSSKDGTVRQWDVATGVGRALAGRHAGPVDRVLFFPDGRRVASRDRKAEVRVWDLERGASSVLSGASGEDAGLALSPDGRTLAYTEAGALVLLDVERATSTRLQGQAAPATAIEFSPDGARVLTGDGTGTVRSWELASGTLRPLSGHTREIVSLVFLPGAPSRFASAARDGTLRLWDLRTGASEVFKGHEGSIYDLAVAPDGKKLLSGGGDNTARLWDVALGTSRVLRGQTDVVVSVVFSPDGRKVAVASVDQSVRLYDLDALHDAVVATHDSAIQAAVVSPGGDHVAFGGKDGVARVVGLEDGATRVAARHEGEVLDLAFSPDGARLASGGEDGRIRLFELHSGAARVLEGHERAVHRLVFSPDGARLFSAGADGTVREWALDSGEGRILELREEEALTVALSPDGTRLLSGWRDGRVWLRELASGQESPLEGHRAPVGVLVFSPDGRVLASGSMDHTIRLWDASSGRLLRSIDASGTGVERLLFFPDGRRFATLGGEANARIWELDSGRLLAVLRGHRGRVDALALSPDGTRLATGGGDGLVRLWDLDAGESRVLEGHQGPVSALGFALGGRALLSTGLDRTVRRWMDDLPVEGAALRAFLEAATPQVQVLTGSGLEVRGTGLGGDAVSP